ncbi:MAG: hypothetical protein GY934_03310 [Gammaproteobacteria bacterium]|nr:hypothetical protein [Gammaproteobacteria bacterium]
MQIDGHHALTYIAARFAGFPHAKASIIAYSAQYVDDATNAGLITFDNGAMYKRISSAHKMLDHRNLDELANHQVWIPFHFLPGNADLPAGENPKGSFVNKLICKPDSPIARDMLKACVADHEKPYGLHRLGISMHVYADTFAHQEFAGVNHKINEVHDLSSSLKSKDRRFWKKIINYFVSEAFPLGHGAALDYPDQPHLVWKYKNGEKKPRLIKRDNPTIFFDAVEKMCRAMYCYRMKDLSLNLDDATGIPDKDALVIKRLIKSIKEEKGEDRHEKWLQEIAKGTFSFGAQKVTYKPKGVGSWKYKSIKQKAASDTGREVFVYSEQFLSSNWKMFHDALQAHRFDVIHDILPQYGISAA